MTIGFSLPSVSRKLHFMGAEYLVPRKKTCPTSIPR